MGWGERLIEKSDNHNGKYKKKKSSMPKIRRMDVRQNEKQREKTHTTQQRVHSDQNTKGKGKRGEKRARRSE